MGRSTALGREGTILFCAETEFGSGAKNTLKVETLL